LPDFLFSRRFTQFSLHFLLRIIVLSIGIGALLGVDLAVFPILIIIWGLGVVLEPFLKKKPK